MNITWVRQEHPTGCMVAATAMIAGVSYTTVAEWITRFHGDNCITQHDADEYLCEHGFAVARKYRTVNGVERNVWPPEPFGTVHLCLVTCHGANGRGHAVVMLHDGTVLDPLSPEPRRLSDYAGVSNVAVITRLVDANASRH